MDYKNRMYRRLSIFFLLMALIALMVFVFILFFMAKDDAFVCPDDQFFCYISSEYSFYRSAVYGLAFSMALLILLSSLFSKQIEFITEYSGYTKSISSTERDKVKEKSESSAALKEYFLHMHALEQERKNREHQTTIDDFVNEEISEDEVLQNDESSDLIRLEENDIILEEKIENQKEQEESYLDGIESNEMIQILETKDENLDEEPTSELEELKEESNEINTLNEFIKVDSSSNDIQTEKEVEYIEVPRKTKKDFEKIIFDQTDLSKTKSKLFLKTLLDVLTEEISQGNIITIKEFGKFEKRTYKSRNAINPKTREKIVIEEHSVARFYANKKFTQLLTENNKVNPDAIKVRKIKKIEQKIVSDNIKKPVLKNKESQTLTKTNTKKEIILQIYEKTALSKNKSKQFLNAFIDVVITEIKNGNSVDIPTIGKLKIVDRAPKKAINPQTKEPILIPEHKALKLKFSKDFKLIINQKK